MLSVRSSTFVNNVATRNGGAVNLEQNSLRDDACLSDIVAGANEVDVFAREHNENNHWVFTDEELRSIRLARSYSAEQWGIDREDGLSVPLSKGGGSLLMDGNTFTKNTAVVHGGAVYVRYVSLYTEVLPVSAFRNLTFQNNSAASGGALCVYRLQGSLVLQDINAAANTAEANTATQAFGQGGFLHF